MKQRSMSPAAGSGSLCCCQGEERILTILRLSKTAFRSGKLIATTFNLARMNMFRRSINYDKFDIRLGNALLAEPDSLKDEKPFDAMSQYQPLRTR